MNIYITDQDLCDLKDGLKTKRYGKYLKDKKFMQGLLRVLSILENAENTSKLSQLSYLHYEQLKGQNKSSVRIVNGMVERLIFTEINGGIEIEIIKLDTEHYGNKK